MPAASTIIETLADLFKRAEEAAIAADPVEDGGTCNFDAPAFRIQGVKAGWIVAAAQQAGIDATDFTWFGKRWFWLGVTKRGQGSRRTLMAEAAHAVLKQFEESGEMAGFSASMYYQMD